MIVPTIQSINALHLVGIRQTMSLTDWKVKELWQSFMQQREHWGKWQDGPFCSVAQYPPDYFTYFDPKNTFVKWAAVQVALVPQLPDGLESMLLPSGLYAVFHYQGLSTDHSIFQYIFTQWLPNSQYVVANRPHFEMLSPLYHPNNPNATEAIYIPITPRM